MNNASKAAIAHLVSTGVINANTGKVDFNKIGKTCITVSSKGHSNSGGGRSGASGKNSSRNGK